MIIVEMRGGGVYMIKSVKYKYVYLYTHTHTNTVAHPDKINRTGMIGMKESDSSLPSKSPPECVRGPAVGPGARDEIRNERIQ